MSDFPGAIDYFVDPSRTFIGENDHKSIVCHGTGGNPNMTVEQLGDFFRTTPSMVSVHYGIGRDGRIAQYCPESAGAGGNGILDPGHDPFWDQYADNPNKHSLSFETINDSSNSLPLTDPQKQTMFKLVAYWVKRYKIPLSNIKGHFSLQPVERAHCPGPNFPWVELFDYLNGGQKPMSNIPSGWSDSGTVLTAPNGIPVKGGFRDHILADPTWHKDNLPLKPEYQANPVEQSNPKLGAGAAQEFRWKRLGWCQQLGIYEGWLGQELVWYQKTLDQAQTALVQLTSENADLQEKLADLQPDALVAENAELKGKIDQAVKVLS